MVVQAPLTRRQVLEKQGGFDESLPALEDWDLWLRCAIAGTAFLYTEQPGTRSLVRVNTASLSHNNAAMTAWHGEDTEQASGDCSRVSATRASKGRLSATMARPSVPSSARDLRSVTR